MSERINPFKHLSDPPAFTTKPKQERPLAEETVARIAEEHNFPSRQAVKSAKVQRRAARIHRTGRNQQFNAKVTAETIRRVYKQADEMDVTLGEWMERAADALDRAGGT